MTMKNRQRLKGTVKKSRLFVCKILILLGLTAEPCVDIVTIRFLANL